MLTLKLRPDGRWSNGDRVTAQDKQICEAVRRNLDAGIYRGGVLSPKHEASVAWFQDRIVDSDRAMPAAPTT